MRRLRAAATAASADDRLAPRERPGTPAPLSRRPLPLVGAGRIVVMLMAAAAFAGACGSEPAVEPVPTTLPVLTTLRPQLTTTTMAAPPPQRRIYVVQPDDTLGKIANGFGVSVEALMEENGKEDTLLRIGEQLVIPPTQVGANSSQ